MEMNIACATDNKFAPYCGIMLTSLFENNKKNSFSVYIMSRDLSEENRSKFGTLGREDLFVEKLQQLMTNPELRRKMGAAARRSIYERYTVEIIMQKWVALFRELGVTNK